MTANAKTRKTEMDAKAQSGKTDGLLKKMQKINAHVKERDDEIKEQKQTAKKNQEELTNLIKEVKDLETQSKMNPFGASMISANNRSIMSQGSMMKSRAKSKKGNTSVMSGKSASKTGGKAPSYAMNASLSPIKMVNPVLEDMDDFDDDRISERSGLEESKYPTFDNKD